MFEFSVKSVNSSFVGFTLAELIISMGIVGLVILPVMLTSTTVMSKGLVKSSAHYKTNTQLNNLFNDINNVFDNSSAVVAPATTLFANTAWQPAQEFELTYYNANMARAEKMAYHLEEVNSKWYLNKVQYSVPSGNENVTGTVTKTKVSPYSNLNITQVEIKNNGLAPSFSYCIDSTNCTNTLASLTPDYMQRVQSVKLNMAGLQVTAKDIAPTEGAFTTGNKVFNLGSKYQKESSGDLYSASFLKSVPLTQLYGVSDVSDIDPLTASVQEASQSSLVMASRNTTTVISNPEGSPTEIGQGSGSIASTGIKIERIVADTLRGTYAFVGTDTLASPNTTKLYFYDANTDVIEVISNMVKPSGALKPADFEDYPLAIDELTGRVFWVSDTKDNIIGSTAATNPFAKTLGLSDTLFLLGWDPYQRELGRFIVDVKGASCGVGNCEITNLQYTLIPDHRTGTLWALLDNAGIGSAGKTLVLAIDTNKIVTSTETLLSDVAGASGLDYINSWDQTAGSTSDSGDIYLGASTNSKTALVRLKSYRNGSNVKQYLKAVVATDGAQAYGLDDAAKAQRMTSLVTVNDDLNKAVIMDKDGLFLVTDGPAFSSLTSRSTETGSTTGCHRSYGDSFQPRQFTLWNHNNFYYGLTDEDKLYSYCRTDNTADDGSIWVDRKGKVLTPAEYYTHAGNFDTDNNIWDPLLNTATTRRPRGDNGLSTDADKLTLYPARAMTGSPQTIMSSVDPGYGIPAVEFSNFGLNRSQATVNDYAGFNRFFGVDYPYGAGTRKGLIVYSSYLLVDWPYQKFYDDTDEELGPTPGYIDVQTSTPNVDPNLPPTVSTRYYKEYIPSANEVYGTPAPGCTLMPTKIKPWRGPVLTFGSVYYLRDSGTESPWIFPINKHNFTFFTYFDGTNFRLDQYLGQQDYPNQGGGYGFLLTNMGWRRMKVATCANSTQDVNSVPESYKMGKPGFKSNTVTTPVIESTFMKRAKQVDISAVNSSRTEIVLNSKNISSQPNIVRWATGWGGLKDVTVNYNGNLGIGQSELGRNLNYGNPRVDMEVSRPIALADHAEDTYLLSKGVWNWSSTKSSNRGGGTHWSFITHFHCDSSVRQGYKKSSSNCYKIGELPLPSAYADAYLTSGTSDMAINTSPGNTNLFILGKDSVGYRIDRISDRNAETSPSMSDTVISNNDIIDSTYGETAASVSSLTYSNKTGNIYLLKSDASVLDAKSNRTGLLLKAFKPGTGGTYSRDRSKDVILPLDAASVGDSAIAFASTEYNQVLGKTRVRYDSKNRLIHLFSNVAGRQRVYTYQEPAGRPF